MAKRRHVYYAHTLDGKGPSEWELLEAHLENVRVRCLQFGSEIGIGWLCELAGFWHDLGKYSREFQSYISAASSELDLEAPRSVDHSTRGSQYAVEQLGVGLGGLIAYAIAGHHGRMPDWTSVDGFSAATLKERLANQRIPHAEIPTSYRRALGDFVPRLKSVHRGMTFSMLTRMIFSVLVDADRLETQRFCNPEEYARRMAPTPTIEQLREQFDAFMQSKRSTNTKVNQIRSRVLDTCMAKASLPAGHFFSLSVPTGGGKTLSSMAFALHHAVANELRRVVVAVPFTTIIDQTADVYRQAMGPLAERAILEHHSNIDINRQTLWAKWCAENWASPIVLTTNVQLYESLFAAGASRCRKLHNLARSVIILDEAQTLPVEFLDPTLKVLQELVTNYGCSIVLCTATQPALEKSDDFPIGLPKPIEIVDDAPLLYSQLKRVRVEKAGVLTPEQLLSRLAAEERVLCIVNTRPQAAELYQLLATQVGREGCFHLSTFMCATHRRQVLETIRARLLNGLPCRAISTQLVEAGVDLDFPVVYRAATGLDSLAQAAGRCNREGRLPVGRVVYFSFPKPPPAGMQRAVAQSASELLDQFDDLISPQAIAEYFSLHYWRQKHLWDKREILELFAHTKPEFQFRTCECRYQLIDDEQCSIVVPYDQHAKKIIAALLRDAKPDFTLLRDAQKYLVGVNPRLRDTLLDNRVIIPIGDPLDANLWVLANDAAYSNVQGLLTTAVGIDPSIGIL